MFFLLSKKSKKKLFLIEIVIRLFKLWLASGHWRESLQMEHALYHWGGGGLECSKCLSLGFGET